MSDELDFSVLQPTVLDLFCGAGGMSLGFECAGYDVVAGVDYDDAAIATYEENHDARAIQCDLAETEPSQFADEYDIHPPDIDVVVGGPPCQGFSKANIDRHVDDERNNLVFVFADYVDYYQPTTFLMENVKGIQSLDGGAVLDRLLNDLRDSGYEVEYRVLNAADFGVPQTRERVFVQGHVDGEIQWPARTHVPRDEIDEAVGDSDVGGVVS